MCDANGGYVTLRIWENCRPAQHKKMNPNVNYGQT